HLVSRGKPHGDSRMDLGLRGRTAVVTGGSKGIGKAIARRLAAEGANIILLARGKELLDAATAEIHRESGVRTLTLQADIRNADQVAAAADTAKGQFEAVHVLVNNAGGPIKRMDRQITWPDSDWVDDVNLKAIGMLRVVQAFLPLMARDGTGRIVNISGV